MYQSWTIRSDTINSLIHSMLNLQPCCRGRAAKINNACELGFGQGLRVFNFHALHTEIDWYGNDFNPQQAQFAKGLNSAGKLNSLIVDDDFATFCSRDDLPSLNLFPYMVFGLGYRRKIEKS